MNKLICKTLVVFLLILGCATLALRAVNSSATVAASVPKVPGTPPPASTGATDPQFGDSQCVSNVPRSWGQYRGGSNQAGLAFEASDGTLRFVTNLPCGATPVIALEVRRTPASGGNSAN